MRGNMKILVIPASFLVLLILTGSIASADDTRFQSPLDSITSVKESGSLALSEVLSLAGC